MLGGKMKAIVKNENAFGATLKEIPIPSINENEVLISTGRIYMRYRCSHL